MKEDSQTKALSLESAKVRGPLLSSWKERKMASFVYASTTGSLIKNNSYGHPVPEMDQFLHSAKHSKCKSTLDLQSGYWQVPVAAADRDKTAFVGLSVSTHSKKCLLVYATHQPPLKAIRQLTSQTTRHSGVCLSRWFHYNFTWWAIWSISHACPYLWKDTPLS